MKCLNEFLRDPGFLFNTGYLGTFASLAPALGWAPFCIMLLNWMSGCFVALFLKPSASPEAAFLRRPNTVLALNGIFLLASGAVTFFLTAAGVLDTLPDAFTIPDHELFAAALALGFGYSNLKKASELDNTPLGILKNLGMISRIKSEVIVAVCSLFSCLMTGGWSLLAAPVIFYAMKLGEDKATNPGSPAFRFTRWLAVSKRNLLPQSAKNGLLRQHPLTIARALLGFSLLFSALIGLINLAGRSALAGVISPDYADLAAAGNLFQAVATYRLYKMTDIACGNLWKN